MNATVLKAEAIYAHGKTAGYSSNTTVLKGSISGALANGPYFINSAGQIFEAWRLYSDMQGAFTESVMANGDGSYSVLPAGIAGQKLAIAVPSRLYFTKTADQPLAGVRVGIKDIYDIKGLRTSDGNRAWYFFYPPAEFTAPPVQNLIDAGAIIIGKLLTSQFANGETATADWVDYHEAFNPRGDGYQDTSSSSSGAGAGTAAYPWLDISMGSDTGGSIRGPSEVQGLFGNRPSHGLVSLDHVMPLSPPLDTSGLLARDPVLWRQAAQAVYGSNITISNSYPKFIKTLGFPTSASSIPNQILLNFLSQITSFLQANTSAYSVTSAFAQSYPSLPPLTTILNLTYPLLIGQQQVQLVRDPFFAAYAAKYDGRTPFVDPVPLTRWAFAESLPQTVDDALANKTLFMNWAASTFLAPSNKTCSENIVLYVGSTAEPNPRNVYLDPPTAPYGFGNSRISPFVGNPDFVIPVGEAPMNSTITNHVEYLPVTVDIMAAKGCDGMLFSLIEDLTSAGILKVVQAGRSGFTGGEILLKRQVAGF